MSEAGKNRRDRAAAAREEANAGERKRERMVRIIGAMTVVVVVFGIIGVALVARNSSDTGTVAAPSADPNAPLPATALPADDERAFAVPYPGTTSADAPVLEIWEDFQCPACGAVEAANGAGIESLADAGKIQLIWRPTTFLDRNLGNDASARATAAWGCAIDAGKATEYHTHGLRQPARAGGHRLDRRAAARRSPRTRASPARTSTRSPSASPTTRTWDGLPTAPTSSTRATSPAPRWRS